MVYSRPSALHWLTLTNTSLVKSIGRLYSNGETQAQRGMILQQWSHIQEAAELEFKGSSTGI